MKKADLKKLTGLSNGSLYYYEKLGLFQPNRTKNNYRLYDKSDFGKVICVQKYNRLGVTIQDLVIALTERDIEYLHGLLEKLQDQKTGRGTRGVNEMGKKTCENGAAV